jgi:hypothetical protein
MTFRTAVRGSGEAGGRAGGCIYAYHLDQNHPPRHLTTTMQIIKLRILPLYRMRLEYLVLECESVPAPSLAASILLAFPHLPETLVSLRLTCLPSITPLLLKEIAGRCANLRELELSVVQRLCTDCCWVCFEESSSSNEHSPVGSDACSATAGDLAVSGRPCPNPLPRSTRCTHFIAAFVRCTMLGTFDL